MDPVGHEEPNNDPDDLRVPLLVLFYLRSRWIDKECQTTIPVTTIPASSMALINLLSYLLS
jgi:hypothetical protein